MKSLRTVTRLLASHFRELGALRNATLPIEELDLLEWRTGGDQALQELEVCPVLPRLRTLVMGERSPEQIAWLFQAPLCQQLHTFGMHYNVVSIAPWQAALDRETTFPVKEVAFGSFEIPSEGRLGFQMTLTRSNAGDWSRVILRRPPGGEMHSRLQRELDSIRVTELIPHPPE